MKTETNVAHLYKGVQIVFRMSLMNTLRERLHISQPRVSICEFCDNQNYVFIPAVLWVGVRVEIEWVPYVFAAAQHVVLVIWL